MYFHPADTTLLYSSVNDRQIENLWYRIHYFQQKSLDKKDNERMNPLQGKINLSQAARDLLDGLLEQREACLSQLSPSHEVAILRAALEARLVHGMGGAHVRETSITLHPLYGIPYIPASSLKGTVRGWVLQAFFCGQEKKLNEGAALSPELQQVRNICIDLFGNQERSGALQFYDAFFDRSVTMVPDVLTVHFPKYYGGTQAAGDDQSPNPVSFYAVQNGQLEIILSLSSGRSALSSLTASELISLAIAWTGKALLEQGVGSKRSAGYGYFQHIEDISAERNKTYQQRKMQETAKRVKAAEAEKQALEQAKLEKQAAEAKASMKPAEQLVYDIQQLSLEEKDKTMSKDEIFKKVKEFAADGDPSPAGALKNYWDKAGLWQGKGNSKKQIGKVNEIKKILGE